MSEPEVLEEQNFPRAGLFRRLAALIYDMFLVAAIWMLLGFIFQQIFGIENQVIDGRVMTDPVADNLLFILMVLSCFTFYSWFWMRSGQTLGMLAWRIRVKSIEEGKINFTQALVRFLAAWPAFLMLGLGYFWIFFDDQGDAVHDKLSYSKVIVLPKSYSPFNS